MNWRVLFWLAAGFNWANGLPLLFFPKVMQTILDTPALSNLTIDRVAGFLLVCQGIVFAFFSTDLPRYRPLIWIVLLSKIGTAAILGQAWTAGQLPFKPIGLVLADMGLGALFLIYLLSTKSPDKAAAVVKA